MSVSASSIKFGVACPNLVLHCRQVLKNVNAALAKFGELYAEVCRHLYPSDGSPLFAHLHRPYATK